MKQTELGIKITELRTQNNMTQKELADLCDVDIRTIQRIESGDVVPRMHTLKLLSTTLGFELNHLHGKATVDDKGVNKKIRLSFFAGVIFSINAIPVIFYLITKSLNPFVHFSSMVIYILSSIVFFRGFYLLGKKCGNVILIISSLITVILLPLINLMELLKVYLLRPVYHPSLFVSSAVFTLVCVNAILFAIGLFNEAARKKSLSPMNLYKIAGIMTILQSVLFLSLNPTLVAIGLIISFGTDVLLTAILYNEQKHPGKVYVNPSTGISVAW